MARNGLRSRRIFRLANQCVGLLERLAAHDTASTTATVSASVLLPEEESLPLIPGFEIEAEIGRGGMGVVYRAWEPKLAGMWP